MPRTYTLKPLDPGQPIEWVRHTDAHWEGRVWGPHSQLIEPGTWVEAVSETRTGVIWSVGPVAASERWVQPDDDPMHPVLVKRQGKKWSSSGIKQGAWYEVIGAAEAARLNVLRAEYVRRNGIYPTVRATYSARYGGTTTYVHWHADTDCATARAEGLYVHSEHKDNPKEAVYGWSGPRDYRFPWTPTDVAIALTSGGQVPTDLCATCIVNAPEEAVRAA